MEDTIYELEVQSERDHDRARTGRRAYLDIQLAYKELYDEGYDYETLQKLAAVNKEIEDQAFAFQEKGHEAKEEAEQIQRVAILV